MPEDNQQTEKELIADLKEYLATSGAQDAKPATTVHADGSKKSSFSEEPWDPTHLCFGILCYAVLIIGITAFLIYKKKVSPPIHDNQWFVRVLVVPMCIVAAVFLTIAGYSQQQIVPVVGLLGTIIGYLLGSAPRQSGGPTQNNTDGAGI